MFYGKASASAINDLEILQTALEEQRQLTERFRLLFEHAPDGLTLLDPHVPEGAWPIVTCNHAFCQMNGYRREELIGFPIDIVHEAPKSAEQRARYLERLRQNGSITLEVTHRRKDGTTFIIETCTSLIEIEGREYVIGVDRDVTEQKGAEAQIHRYAEELLARNVELDAYAHTIAHDLRSPLTNIIGFLDLIQSDLVDELDDTAHMIGIAIQAGHDMVRMIDSMLLFASLRDASEVSAPVDLQQVINAAIQRLSRQLHDRNVNLNIQPNLPWVCGYAPWLEEVFANLLDNAIKYAGHDNLIPSIQVQGEQQPDGIIRITVTDNGIGIPADHQDRVFDMFTRGDTGSIRGTGLGLSIVGRIIDRLGGEVGVESADGSGSTFWFTLPAA